MSGMIDTIKNAFKIPDGEVLVASTHIEQGVLPEDGALWMRLS